jgi:fluoroacetyl-CoA thioesterase
MKETFKPGDSKEYKRVVQAQDVAAFHGEVVHPVCSTFSLARDIEWTTRQFVLEMKEESEEGVGTFLTVEHKGPAFVGEEILFKGKIEQINGHELICSYEAHVGSRLIAVGKTGQKILKKEKIDKLFRHPLSPA